MCSNDDYVNWDEVDLDALLVEYTDDDCFGSSNVDTDSDASLVAVNEAESKRRRPQKAVSFITTILTKHSP